MKCDYDCFNCVYSDCKQNELSIQDRAEAKERDVDVISHNITSRQKKWYWDNHEKSLEMAKRSYWQNHEKSLEHNRNYYYSHKDKFRDYSRRWKEEHKDLIKQRQRQYYLNWKAKKEKEQNDKDNSKQYSSITEAE